MSSLHASLPISSDAAAIHRIIVEVLRVPPERVHPDADLVYELGAESIDFLDLLFSLDTLVGTRVLPERWGTWLKQRLPGVNDGSGITPRVIEEFVVSYRDSASPQPSAGDAS
jgi:acyl carrier protein